MVTSIFGPILMAIGISVVNHFFWDSTLFHSLPENITTQTFTLLFVNGVFFWLLVKVLPGIEVVGLFPAIAGPIVFTVVATLVKQYGGEIDWSLFFKDIQQAVIQLKDYVQASVSSAVNSP